MNPRDIAEALSKAGVDRLPPPAVAYLGERMGRSDLARCNLGGLRRISFGCARAIGDGRSEPVTPTERWAYYRILDDGAHWMPGYDVLSDDKAALRVADARVRTKMADEPPNSVLIYRAWTNGVVGDDQWVLVKDNYEPGNRPEMARKLGIQGIGDGGEPFDPAIIRGTVDEFDTFADLDAAARALVSVAYRAAPRAWGEVGEAELATLGSYPIRRIGAAEKKRWTYYRDMHDSGTSVVLAENVFDTKRQDAHLRIKFADEPDIEIFRSTDARGPSGEMTEVVTVLKREQLHEHPGYFPQGPDLNGSGAKVGEVIMPERDKWMYVRESEDGSMPSRIRGGVTDSGIEETDAIVIAQERGGQRSAEEGGMRIRRLRGLPPWTAETQKVILDTFPPVVEGSIGNARGTPATYPTGIPPELEQTMRALVADWEGFDRSGVGSKVLPEFRPQAEDFRKTRDAWKAGTLDQATLDQTIQSATQVASQVRDALVKSGVVDPGLGPAAVKAAETAQAKPAEAATSWMDRIPALKWLNDPKGPKVRVEADSIVPAEWRAPIVLGVSALALYALTSRKHSRRTYASE